MQECPPTYSHSFIHTCSRTIFMTPSGRGRWTSASRAERWVSFPMMDLSARRHCTHHSEQMRRGKCEQGGRIYVAYSPCNVDKMKSAPSSSTDMLVWKGVKI